MDGLGHTASFEDLTRSLGSIGQSQGDNLVESRELDIVQNDQGTVDAANGVVADARLDVHHPGVDGEILSGHVCGGDKCSGRARGIDCYTVVELRG